MNAQELQKLSATVLERAQSVGIDPDKIREVWAMGEQFRTMADEVAKAVVIGYTHADPVGGMGFTCYLVQQAESEGLTKITGDWVRNIVATQAADTVSSLMRDTTIWS